MADTRRAATVVASTGRDFRRVAVAGLMALGVVAVLATLPGPRAHARGAMALHRATGRATDSVLLTSRTSRLDAAEWALVKQVIHLRAMALGPHRTALYRSFSAYLGLSELMQLHPVLAGRCATAVSSLYDNLLDLHTAYPGEDWAPLRRLIRQQPRLTTCAPKARPRVIYVS